MMKNTVWIMGILLIMFGGTWIFNHWNAWLGILVIGGGAYALVRIIKKEIKDYDKED